MVLSGNSIDSKHSCMDTNTKPHMGHISYLFNMWTKQQLQQFTKPEVVAERFRLHSLRSNYQLQNVDPPQELLADIDLLKDEIQAHLI